VDTQIQLKLLSSMLTYTNTPSHDLNTLTQLRPARKDATCVLYIAGNEAHT